MMNVRWGRVPGALGVLALAGSTAFAQDPEPFQIDPAASSITIRVAKTGLLSFAGHEHEVVAPAVTGTLALNRSTVDRSSVTLEFDAAALKVTGKGEPAADVPEVQRVMVSDRVLDVQRYPKITFRSLSVTLVERTGTRIRVRLNGELTLHGVTRPLTVPADVQLTDDRLTADGQATLRQTDFGIQPVTAGAGTVKVRDQVDVSFKLVARKR
jgi:polyisoprenoid-binding protein YceI